MSKINFRSCASLGNCRNRYGFTTFFDSPPLKAIAFFLYHFLTCNSSIIDFIKNSVSILLENMFFF